MEIAKKEREKRERKMGLYARREKERKEGRAEQEGLVGEEREGKKRRKRGR